MVKNMLIDYLKKQVGYSEDYIFKEVLVDNKKVNILFNEVLTNGTGINDFILRELILLKKKDLKNLCAILPNTNIKVIKKEEILDYVNQGFLIIMVYGIIYASEFKAFLDRGITTIESELAINGPKDSFCENFNTNLGLIRRRIKSCDLQAKSLLIGRSTLTKVAILYMNNIADNKLVENISKILEQIDIDGIIDSSYLKFALEGRKSFFPTIMMSERPDKSAMALLEGKIVILVDMSPYTLILPSFFLDFFHTVDDYYQKPSNASFIRIIRVFAFIIAVFTPAIYIAITTRNYNLVPLPLLLMLKAGRTFVPFPAYIEALFMIVCFEILRESDVRMSSTSGSAVSILGGLILGDAAVAAGIVSPIMIIVIAISSIAALIFTSLELVNALRNYKIFLLILGTIFGIYGVIIGSIIMLYKIISLRLFGYHYISIDENEINDSIVKINKRIRKRNSILTKNVVRGKYK